MRHKARNIVAEFRFKVVTNPVKSLDKRHEIFTAADDADVLSGSIRAIRVIRGYLQNCRSSNLPRTKTLERFIRIRERKCFEEGSYRYFRRDLHEIFSIFPGEICDGAQDTLAPQQ